MASWLTAVVCGCDQWLVPPWSKWRCYDRVKSEHVIVVQTAVWWLDNADRGNSIYCLIYIFVHQDMVTEVENKKTHLNLTNDLILHGTFAYRPLVKAHNFTMWNFWVHDQFNRYKIPTLPCQSSEELCCLCNGGVGIL